MWEGNISNSQLEHQWVFLSSCVWTIIIILTSHQRKQQRDHLLQPQREKWHLSIFRFNFLQLFWRNQILLQWSATLQWKLPWSHNTKEVEMEFCTFPEKILVHWQVQKLHSYTVSELYFLHMCFIPHVKHSCINKTFQGTNDKKVFGCLTFFF